jgi:hypothetical protein
MAHDNDDAFDSRGLLKDGRSWRVPIRFCDSLQHDVARHTRDRAGPLRIVDQYGTPLGLNKPGWRREVGGNQGDALVRDGQQAEIERAYAAYDARVSRAYLLDQDENGDEEELAGREAELHAALTGAGGSPDDVSEYLENLDDDELLTGDVGYHLAAFRRRYNSQDAARRQRDRLQRLYDQRDAETSAMWKQNR